MPKKERPENQHLPQKGLPRALSLFTDRDIERAIIGRFFEALERDGMRPDRPILSFYGVGGVGKTTLLHKAVQEFTELHIPGDAGLLHRALAEWQVRHGERLRIALLSVDDDQWKLDTVAEKFFRLLRGRLADLGIDTPLLDLMLLAYWQKSSPGQELNIQSSPLQEYCGKASEYGEVLGAFSSVVAECLGSLQHVRMLDRLVGKLRDHRRSREILELVRQHPDEMTLDEQMQQMPRLLAADLEAWLEAHPKSSLCIAIDGFERIQTTKNAEDLQRYVVRLCEGTLVNVRNPTTPERMGYLIIGREKLRWRELYDDADTPEAESWDAYIDSHLLGGLSKQDALIFLVQNAASALDASGPDGRAAAEMIRKHTEDILNAADEAGGKDGRHSYYPYYLDLAVDLVVQAGARFDPSMLGRTPDELQKRFLRYLREHREPELRSLQSLSVCLYFDKEVFSFLVRAGDIIGFRASDFGQIVKAERSYVSALPDRDGFYRFHRHMQEALIADQMKSDRDAAKQIVEKLLGWLVERAKFAKPAEFSEAYGRAYEHGVNILLNAGKARLLSGETVMQWFDKFEKPFDEATFVAGRLPGQRALCSLLGELLGNDHPDVLRKQSILASHLEHLAQFDEALTLGRTTLEAQERVQGLEHADTLMSLHNFAGTLFLVGNLAEAEMCAARAFEGWNHVRGKDDRFTLRAANTLAVILCGRGNLTAAEALNRRTLQAREVTLGPEHADTLASVTNLAIVLAERGNHQEARSLCSRALDVNERILGATHLDTLNSVNNLAYEFHLLGDYVAAKPLFKRALEGLERILGADHPETLNVLVGYAVMLKKSGDHSHADPLFRKALAAYGRASFRIHHDTMHELALFAHEHGDYESAKDWCRKALDSRELKLGKDHPDALASAKTLWAILNERGDPEADELKSRYFGGQKPQPGGAQ